MAITAADYIRPSRGLGLSSHPTIVVPEGASQTFAKGDPLIASSGYAVTASADPVSVIIGIAAEDGNNDSSAGDSSIGVYPAIPGMLFEGVVGGTSSALAATDRFTKYGLAKYTSSSVNVWYIDKDESSSSKKTVRIIEFIDAVSTANGRVVFTFIGTNATIVPTIW